VASLGAESGKERDGRVLRERISIVIPTFASTQDSGQSTRKLLAVVRSAL